MKKLKWMFLQTVSCVVYCEMIYHNSLHQFTESEVKIAWINFVIQVAIMVALAMVLAPKPKQPKKPIPIGIEQFDVPTAEEGRAIQVCFGKRFVASPNVVWYGDLRSTPVMG